MELQLNKTQRIQWNIKNERLKAFTISTLEEQEKLLEISFSAVNSDLSFDQFLVYCDYLTEIRNTLLQKYSPPEKYSPSTLLSLSTSLSTAFSISASSSKMNEESLFPKLKSKIPVIVPSKLDIPELYIIANNGLCLYHFEFYGQIKEQPINQNLVTGLLSAINSFAVNIGWTTGLNLIRSGNTELRFSRGKYITVALLTHVDMKLSYLVEQILMDLAKDLGIDFEKSYTKELESCEDRGVNDPHQFHGFNSKVNDFFIQYRKQTFELYQKLILTEAMYLDIPPEICSDLIHKLTLGKSVVGEISEISQKYPVITKAIEKVNRNQLPMWQIFNIPVFEL